MVDGGDLGDGVCRAVDVAVQAGLPAQGGFTLRLPEDVRVHRGPGVRVESAGERSGRIRGALHATGKASCGSPDQVRAGIEATVQAACESAGNVSTRLDAARKATLDATGKTTRDVSCEVRSCGRTTGEAACQVGPGRRTGIEASAETGTETRVQARTQFTDCRAARTGCTVERATDTSDGTDRDVTSLVVFQSNNDNSATVSPDGTVTAKNRGEAFVTARFATFTVGSQVVVIPQGLKYERPKLAANNYIDELVHDKLHKLRMTPSGQCTDEAFARRSFLDIAGLLPEPDELADFLADEDPEKRNNLVKTLLDRKEFTEMWVMKWAELLQIRTQQNNQVSYKATLLYHNWLKDRIANNVPFNRIVQELLPSTGGTFKSPATNYYQIERDTLKVSENVAQVFMGMRIQCAQCHNHPFDRWTMDDYYSFAAFFSQIGRKNAEDPREVIVFNKRNGEVKHPIGGRNMTPKFLGGAVPEIARSQDRRAVMAKWLASEENPFFAPNLANMIWAHFFGIGIIEPVDDVRISNPASNPELLADLAKRFTEYNYDFKRLVYDICTSRTYQLATRTNESNAADSRNFAHGRIRRLRAEVLLDVITQVTQTKNKFKGLPLGARAVQIADGNVGNYFLTTFGRATRETVCSCEVKMEPNLSQALHLMNGDIVQARIKNGGLIKELLKERSPAEGIKQLYLRTLCRPPSADEQAAILGQLEKEPDKQAAMDDVFWALLNSKEFIFTH